MTRLIRLTIAVALTALLAGCSNGQWIDAGGENGGGGNAFVALTVMCVIFVGSLFFLDRVRRRKDDDDSE